MPGILQLLRIQRRRLRRALQRRRVATKRRVSRSDLVEDLMDLGLQPGDTVIVHSALSEIGFVDGGAATVIEALLEVLGPQGTLVMPSFPFDTYVEDYLAAHREFDATETPSRMGKITETFRRWPGVRRSLHPTHPVTALGPQAAYLTGQHHEGRTTFGNESPFFRLCECDGKILLLGVDFTTMTNLHVVEDNDPTFPYRVYTEEEIPVTLRDESGNVFPYVCRVHAKALSSLRDCNKMEPYFHDARVLIKKPVGEAVARLMPAAGILRCMQELASRGITMYRDEEIPPSRRRTASAPSA